MITIPADSLRQGRPGPEALRMALRQFEAGLPRLNRLARYYEGRHDIAGRARLPGLPNTRLAHAFPRYIAQVSAAYLLGEPVRLEGPEPATGALRALLARAGADSVDAQLALHQAVYGRAVSLCYEDAAGQPRLCALDPRAACVVHDDTVAQVPLFGLCLGQGPAREMSVYTPHEVLLTDSQGRVRQARPHAFGALPMAEYPNGGDGQGDFEQVLALVDAYDLLQSDRLNDRQQFSDALLVLTGVMGIAEDGLEGPGALERLRQEKTLALPDEHARAEWLVKTPLERDIEVLREALAQDIHKFSLTPDFSDVRFAGNASGIAIKYKLFNFDNRVKLKERFFTQGLMGRAEALCGWLDQRQGLRLRAEELRFILSRRLPVNELERAQTLAQLRDIVPLATLRHNAPLTPAPGDEGVGGEQ
ncbi:MAG: phage portal protein [Clostridiales bacterium]|nr:phage portal protein [Clostridiales bacterium]